MIVLTQNNNVIKNKSKTNINKYKTFVSYVNCAI